jgi:predicted TIM-barrel fold metal-dependent hydrolase
MLREAGMPSSALRLGLDQHFRSTLLAHVETSGLDAAVLLAQDWPHDDRGEPLRDKAGFFVPNDYLLRVCAESGGRFIPAVSIHPYRADACRELERCVSAGAKVLKLLPNCHNADCNAPRTRDFWKLMTETGTVFLSHTGGEYTVPVLNRAFEDPEVLRLPLESGVTCIAAHAAGASAPWGACYTEKLIRMFGEYPHLYCDNSATATPNRAGSTRRLLRADAVDRVLHGSDFPVPVGALGPWAHGLVGWGDLRAASAERNPVARDALIKRAMGYPESTFTRLDGLLRR